MAVSAEQVKHLSVYRGGSGAGSLGGAQQLTGGGGVVAEIFRDLQKPSRFSGGGGVVAEIFRDLQKPSRFSGGGGVVADNFLITSPETDPIRSRERDTYHTFPHLPRYSLIDKQIWQLTYTNKEITQKKKSNSNGLGGARAPQAPPGSAYGIGAPTAMPRSGGG